MSDARDGDHPSPVDSTNDRQQQTGQREMAEMVGSELNLVTVDGATEVDGHDTGVVHQHVDGSSFGDNRFREGADGTHVGEIQRADLEHSISALTFDLRRGGGGLVGVSTGHHHRGAVAMEVPRALQTDPRIRSRDHEQSST